VKVYRLAKRLVGKPLELSSLCQNGEEVMSGHIQEVMVEKYISLEVLKWKENLRVQLLLLKKVKNLY